MEENNEKKSKLYEKWWFWVIVAITVVGIVGASNDNKNMKNSNTIDTAVKSNEEKVIFLKGSRGKEFYEILCDVANVEKKGGLKSIDTIDYTSGNENYGIEVETNNKDEINWISIYTLLPDNYENFFLAISRLEYNDSNRAECFNWIKENLGKESNIKIGSANFKVYNGTSGKPILEVYTDGNEEFQNEQLNKLK